MLSQAMNSSKEVILLGDVNVNYLRTNDHKPFKQILELFGLKQIFKKPTRLYQLLLIL